MFNKREKHFNLIITSQPLMADSTKVFYYWLGRLMNQLEYHHGDRYGFYFTLPKEGILSFIKQLISPRIYEFTIHVIDKKPILKSGLVGFTINARITSIDSIQYLTTLSMSYSIFNDGEFNSYWSGKNHYKDCSDLKEVFDYVFVSFGHTKEQYTTPDVSHFKRYSYHV